MNDIFDRAIVAAITEPLTLEEIKYCLIGDLKRAKTPKEFEDAIHFALKGFYMDVQKDNSNAPDNAPV